LEENYRVTLERERERERERNEKIASEKIMSWEN
jgi:hypothetical protein